MLHYDLVAHCLPMSHKKDAQLIWKRHLFCLRLPIKSRCTECVSVRVANLNLAKTDEIMVLKLWFLHFIPCVKSYPNEATGRVVLLNHHHS